MLGILGTSCSCDGTRTDSAAMLASFYVTDVTTDISDGDTIRLRLGASQTIGTNIPTFADSKSLVCGDASGTTYCGARTLRVIDVTNGVDHDVATSTMMTFNTNTGDMVL